MSPRFRAPLLLAFALALAPAPARAQDAAALDAGRATLPLDELLALRRELDAQKRKPAPVPPPIAAAVDGIELSGRLEGRSLELEAKIGVTVLADGWISVPILRVAPGLQVTHVPSLEGATLAVQGGWLALVTKSARSWRFSVSLLERSPEAPGPHRLELETAPATLARLRVQYDERSFRIEGPVTREADGVRVDPEGTRFRLAWQARGARRRRRLSRCRGPSSSRSSLRRGPRSSRRSKGGG